VTFAYEELPVLRDFSFRVSPGEMVALVGPSGVGKSTIISLLNRFYDPQSGAVTVDGIDIRRLTMKSLADNIALVDQETFLFHDTIKNNIRYGRPEATDEEVVTAARQAYADEFIRLLPEQYDTSIGDRGIRLSGVQRQRLAIARALVQKPELLILDEATSALDQASAAAICETLAPVTERRTTLWITHRLVAMERMDEIIVLDGGRVVERGSHADLMAQGGLYAALWGLQHGEIGA